MNRQAGEGIVVLIPALNPDEKLTEYVRALKEIGFLHILLVDDGSNPECGDIFEKLEQDEGVVVLHHERNLGKGRALKTGISYCMEHYLECVGIVTADSDGQHSPEDTLRVAEALCMQPECIILGTRDFEKAGVPFKSRYGNRITAGVFALFYGNRIHDTQTGLRGIGKAYWKALAELSGERYEYEMGVLIYAAQRKIPLVELPIETIYINENTESHFRPVVDSIKIYGLLLGCFLKYTISSLSASLIDLGLFFVLSTWVFAGWEQSARIFLATILARLVSSLYNFLVNRAVVFRASGNAIKEAASYYGLVVVQMLCSAALVNCFAGMHVFSATLIKAVVDTLLFFISFQIQHRLIFRNRGEK